MTYRSDLSHIYYIFNPRSIAIVGASSRPGKAGYELLRTIVKNGYKGKIYPINPRGGEILGLKVYRTLQEIPGEIDLALMVLPADEIIGSIGNLAIKGAKGVIIYSSGFGEAGKISLEDKLRVETRENNIRVIGPNCAGIVIWKSYLYASFVPGVPRGELALISQSGALTAVLVEYMREKRLGANILISYGNGIDIRESDVINYFNEDDDIRCFVLYIEGLEKGRGREFYNSIRSVSPIRPVVILKAGRSEGGVRAVRSHTGSLAGDYDMYRAILKQAGAFLVDEYYELIDVAETLIYSNLPSSQNIVIVTNSGGHGAILADHLSNIGISLYNLPNGLVNSLDFLPDHMVKVNPVDLSIEGSEDTYYNVLRTLLEHRWVGLVVALHVAPSFINPRSIAKAIKDSYIDTDMTKPIIPLFMGPRKDLAYDVLRGDHRLPTPFSHRSTALCIKALIERKRFLSRAGVLNEAR